MSGTCCECESNDCYSNGMIVFSLCVECLVRETLSALERDDEESC